MLNYFANERKEPIVLVNIPNCHQNLQIHQIYYFFKSMFSCKESCLFYNILLSVITDRIISVIKVLISGSKRFKNVGTFLKIQYITHLNYSSIWNLNIEIAFSKLLILF